jgi:hypothetical protein
MRLQVSSRPASCEVEDVRGEAIGAETNLVLQHIDVPRRLHAQSADRGSGWIICVVKLGKKVCRASNRTSRATNPLTTYDRGSAIVIVIGAGLRGVAASRTSARSRRSAGAFRRATASHAVSSRSASSGQAIASMARGSACLTRG